MVDKELIGKLRQFKQDHGYTLFELSRKVDVQVATLERWLRTERINRVYAQLIKQKLKI